MLHKDNVCGSPPTNSPPTQSPALGLYRSLHTDEGKNRVYEVSGRTDPYTYPRMRMPVCGLLFHHLRLQIPPGRGKEGAISYLAARALNITHLWK